MKRNSLLLTALLLASGTAMAQYQLDAIQVRPTTGNEITFSCDAKVTPKAIDVEALLQIHDRTQTQQLTNKLMGAVDREGMTLIPLKLYFNERGRAKLLLAIAKGKKLHDKRESEKKRDWGREKGRLLRARG